MKVEIGVSFRCEYPLSVSVKSDGFEVATVNMDGIQSGAGQLDDGFKENVIHRDASNTVTFKTTILWQ